MARTICDPSGGTHLGSQMEKETYQIYCDNQAIFFAWKGERSKQPKLMSLLRMLFLTATKNSFTVTLHHLPGKLNPIADALSRQQFRSFFSLAPQADPNPTPTPGVLRTL
jgi:hypothetical protein